MAIREEIQNRFQNNLNRVRNLVGVYNSATGRGPGAVLLKTATSYGRPSYCCMPLSKTCYEVLPNGGCRSRTPKRSLRSHFPVLSAERNSDCTI